MIFLHNEKKFDAMWNHDKALLAKRVAVGIALYSAVIGAASYAILKNKSTKVALPEKRVA